MQLFIFKSDANRGLQAFCDDRGGEKLPAKFRPWHAVGVVRDDAKPPHNLEPRRDRGLDRRQGLSALAHEGQEIAGAGDTRPSAVRKRLLPRCDGKSIDDEPGRGSR